MNQFETYYKTLPDSTTQLRKDYRDATELPKFAYREGADIPNVHIGQRKLLITEIRFLTEVATGDLQLCIYAGSAKGHHLGIVHKLFPAIKWLLFDTSNHFIVSDEDNPIQTDKNSRVIHNYDFLREPLDLPFYIKKGYFTDDVAKEIKAICDERSLPILFISDVRASDKKNPTDFEVVVDQMRQYQWRESLGNPASLLKTRSAFKQIHRRDILPITDKELNYLVINNLSDGNWTPTVRGDIWLQPWAGRESAEVRIYAPAGQNDILLLNNKEHEDTLFTHNIWRSAVPHKHSPTFPDLGFSQNWDCAMEYHIWSEYIEKWNPDLQVEDLIKESMIYTFPQYKGVITTLATPYGCRVYNTKPTTFVYRSLRRAFVKFGDRQS